MKNKENKYLFIAQVLGVISFLIFVAMIKLGQGLNHPPLLYIIGFSIIIVLVTILIFSFNKYSKLKTVNYLIKSWPYSFDNVINYKNLDSFFNLKFDSTNNNKSFYYLDEQTAKDLNILQLFEKISLCLTSLGEQVLYYILRKPFLDINVLKKRSDIVDEITNNDTLRGDLQFHLYILGKQSKGNILSLITSNKKANKHKLLLFNMLGVIFPVIIILPLFFGNQGIAISFLSIVICFGIEGYFAKQIEDLGNSTGYLANMLIAAKNISKIDNSILNTEIDELKLALKPISKLQKKLSFLMLNNANGENPIGQSITMLLFLRPKTYECMLQLIEENRDDLLRIFEILGTFDSYVSLASFKFRNNEWSTPEFTTDKQFISFEKISHPLIENCVKNNLHLNKKGIILTGSNMSGKSTFMRTIGVNILLAQTVYFVFASNYRSSFFHIITSLDVSDNINTGESYYLAECNSILRILSSINYEHSTFCMIDEIFKGTNPIERISASHEIIKYLMNYNALAIVATHDLALAENCDNNYKCYYFTEHVDSIKGLSFDFTLKEGICKSGNALKLLEFIGYPKIITDKAKENLNNSINIK